MNTPSILISIVVPVYNAEKYLDNMINSVMNQTYQKWELILVDDCSTDNSLSICRKFAELDERIKIVKHTENSGPQSSRTDGIAAATGDYVGFMDTDDFAHPQMYEILAYFAESKNADIVQCTHHHTDGYKIPSFSPIDINSLKSETIDIGEIYKRLFAAKNNAERFPFLVLWSKIIRTDYAKRFEVRFNGGSDTYFAYQVYKAVNKMTLITGSPLYYYMSRQNSVSHKGINRDHLGVLHAYLNMEKDLFDEHSPGHKYAVVDLSNKIMTIRHDVEDAAVKSELKQLLKKELPSLKKRIWNTKGFKTVQKIETNIMLSFPSAYSLYLKHKRLKKYR